MTFNSSAKTYVMQLYEARLDSLRKSFEKSTVVGFKLGEKIDYQMFGSSLEDLLKQFMDEGFIPFRNLEVVYVGKIKFDGDTTIVEEVDMSKVTYEKNELLKRKEARNLVKGKLTDVRQRLMNL